MSDAVLSHSSWGCCRRRQSVARGGQTLFTLFPGKQPWVIVAILLRVSTPNRAMV